ncbi:MAG: hypothetical protein ABI900_03550 [Betaproteobacteria bacterium]
MTAPLRPRSRFSLQSFQVLALLCVGHALIVLLLWIVHSFGKMALMPGQVWLALGWLWLVWPLLLVLHPAGSPRRIFVPVFIGVVMIAPCMASIFLFTAWALDGSAR